jgi:hypothetical protein
MIPSCFHACQNATFAVVQILNDSFRPKHYFFPILLGPYHHFLHKNTIRQINCLHLWPKKWLRDLTGNNLIVKVGQIRELSRRFYPCQR